MNYIVLFRKFDETKGEIRDWRFVTDYDDVVYLVNYWINNGWEYEVYRRGERISL